MNALLSLANLAADLPLQVKPRISGRVIGLRGPLVRAKLPAAAYGEVYRIERLGLEPMLAQVVSFSEDEVALAPLDTPWGVGPGLRVERVQDCLTLSLPESPLGMVIDPLGVPLSLPQSTSGAQLLLQRAPPSPLSRTAINQTFPTGVKAIDAFCSVGYGQRMGIFAGPGTGKSTLLGMIARHAEADVSVIALVGERGREVNDFIQESLGEDGLKRAVVVVATSDESPLRRTLAPLAATAIAEHFRDQGKRVLLLVDSLTRTARALREVSLAAGEMPVRQGYTSSVYTELPRLVERAGTNQHGSITAFYTVLTHDGEENDALGEELRSLLDGHLVLSNRIAHEGVRPAIDLMHSVSRLTNRLRSENECRDIQAVISLIAKLTREKEMLLLGGTPDAALAAALKIEPELLRFLGQRPQERFSTAQALQGLAMISKRYKELLSESAPTCHAASYSPR